MFRYTHPAAGLVSLALRGAYESSRLHLGRALRIVSLAPTLVGVPGAPSRLLHPTVQGVMTVQLFGERQIAVGDRRHGILIIDDERTIADTLDLIFSAGGYETRAAYSAEQALEIIAEWLPDLAIVDVVLPLMNGVNLAIFLTAQYPACRLLLFSGQSLTADLLAEAATKGYKFDILAKPVHPTEILERALNLLVANQSKRAQEVGASEVLRLPEAEPPSET